ncbi:alpha/beta hydrolase [Caenimonas sp. SL110]|uniref:alpha/beta hydrolase n=1 Tax=Caenimonas sp. SL110 TaxID=1450524 RepID=UPI00065438ED|nr:alpha/beta fold hydrolase [Caenimonas sp. SL110]
MNLKTRRYQIAGAAGAIEVLRDEPLDSDPPHGVAVIAHPHPLFAGTMDNKVVQTLARAFVQCGWTAIRFNFRGVGQTAGEHDDGRGELLDMLSVIEAEAPTGPLAIAGFSFGAFVASGAIARLHEQRAIEKVVLIGTAASRFEVSPLPATLHEQALVIHGEEDDTVPLSAVLDWARPQSLPVTVVPGGGHFFHGQLTLLKSLVVRHLRS